MDEEKDYLKARGVGLKESQWVELEKIADELGITLHAISAYGLRWFLKAYSLGFIKVQEKTITALPDLDEKDDKKKG